jgi:hypothetical protein
MGGGTNDGVDGFFSEGAEEDVGVGTHVSEIVDEEVIGGVTDDGDPGRVSFDVTKGIIGGGTDDGDDGLVS